MIKSLALAAAIGAAVSTAEAATPCGPRNLVLATLASNYQERPVAMGLSNSGRLLELMVSQDGKSWTVVTTSPEGVSCVLDAGAEWLNQTVAADDPEA